MLRFAFETVPIYDAFSVRPQRSEPVKTILAWFAGYGRYNGKIDYAQSASFERVTHRGDGSGSGRKRQASAEGEEPLNDLTVAKFFSRLRITLPANWKPRPLEEELAIYEAAQAAKKQKRP